MTTTDLDSFLGVNRPPAWRRLLKWGGVGLAGLVLLLILATCAKGPEPTRYVTAPIARGDLTLSVSATGNLAPTTQINVGSEESGLISKVYVENNDHVVKGQPLAQLDLSLLRAALTQSEASLQAAEASVQQFRATVAQTDANLKREQEVLNLSGGKVPSQTELAAARADHERALANLAQAQAQVAQARAAVSTNKTNLSKGTIYAPVTGVVLSRQVQPGQTVAAAFNVATLFTIAEDLSKMKLEVKVDEADVGDLRAGEAATFTVDAYPGRTFPATVTRVDEGANATPTFNSAGATVTAYTTVVAYTAVLSGANPDHLLRPGMTATALIVTKHKTGVLLAPNAALRFNPTDKPPPKGMFGPPPGAAPNVPQQAAVGRGARRQLWVLDAHGRPQAITVTLGDTDGAQTEVTGPQIRPGLKVVTGQLAKGAPRK